VRPELHRATAALALALAACAKPYPTLEGPLPYETLSEYGFYLGDLKNLEPAAGLWEFEPAAALWSDGADKLRFLALPEGTTLHAPDDLANDPGGEGIVFPEGAILIKNFSFREDFRDPESPSKVVETRLLTYAGGAWTAEAAYLWNDEQTDATRVVGGATVSLSYVDSFGVARTEDYLVPNQNQCKNCHERDDATFPLGPVLVQLDRDVTRDGKVQNQLEWLANAGVFDGPVDPGAVDELVDPFGGGDLDRRARSYLMANCAHCHRPGGLANSSNLVLLAWETAPEKYGVCKLPSAAGTGAGGHEYDIVPGFPDESIVPFRMSSTDPEIKMPELPNRIPDQAGIDLVSEWISGLTPQGCGP
jgi:uncharacterized repeat protein (TIGR03806 family)